MSDEIPRMIHVAWPSRSVGQVWLHPEPGTHAYVTVEAAEEMRQISRRDERGRANYELESLRLEVIEECARIADAGVRDERSPTGIAASIRALATRKATP